MHSKKNYNTPKTILLLLLSMPGFCMAQEKPKVTVKPSASVAATEHTVILTAAMMSDGLKNRPGNEPAKYWTPEPADIALLETDLKKLAKDPAVLNSRDNPYHRNILIYYRQYIGIVQNGKRQIYVSAFHPSVASRFAYWRKRPVYVSDGGPVFYNVIYAIKSRHFGALRFNRII